MVPRMRYGVLDHADNESDICFRAVLGGYRCATFWVYEIPQDIGYDSCRSQRELPEYTHIARKKVPLLWGQKSCFFFCTKKALYSMQSKNHTYVFILLVNGYQNHSHMTLHDLPFLKKWGVKKFIFSDFGYFKGVTGSICNGIKRWCAYYDRGSQEQS